MPFTRKVEEETQRVKRSETLSIKLCGYDVLVIKDEDIPRIQIYRYNPGEGHLRLGIVELRPGSVGALEKFADVASELFHAIAKELRDVGEDDFRSHFEKLMDDAEEETRQWVTERTNGRKEQ